MPAKNRRLLIIIINFFRRVFSECTEENATSLIPLDTILPEKFGFIIGFNSTVWTKIISLAGTLADGELADAFNSSKLVPQKPFTSK